ncbi:MAG: lytic transglycosylase domain-containing protein [Sphingorhabdus sp.]
MGRSKCIVATAFALLVPFSIQAKKPKDEAPPPCPVDTTLRTADPKLLERFTGLSGCADQLLVAPASPSEFVDPDGAVIIGPNRVIATDDEDDEYAVVYADNRIDTFSAKHADLPVSKKLDRSRKKPGIGKPNAKTEYYAYGATSAAPSLSGTGVAIRIVPEPQPVEVAPYAAPPMAGLDPAAGPVSADDSAILAMRPVSFSTRYDDLIGNIAIRHRVDPLFLHAVIYQESRYRPTAVSHAGATGMMQIMPATGRGLGVHPSHLTDPLTNIDAGARLLRKLHGKYGANFELILAAYNAGEGAVQKYGNRVPPYRETQEYVKLVMARYNMLLAEQNAVVAAR